MQSRRFWRWKNCSLAVLLIALSCELDDFHAVVDTKENVAAKALSDQISDLSPPTQSTFGRLLGRIEEGKGEAFPQRGPSRSLEDREDCFGRPTVALTRAIRQTTLSSPLTWLG